MTKETTMKSMTLVEVLLEGIVSLDGTAASPSLEEVVLPLLFPAIQAEKNARRERKNDDCTG